MANVQFTINNISPNTVTYQGQAILASTSYTPSATLQPVFASDPGVVADLLSQIITITVGSNIWSGPVAVEVLRTIDLPYEPQTYSVSANGFVTAATATDVFTINGSASKTIRVHKIKVSGSTTSGSAIKISINLVKRSAANTGGTSSILTAAPHDSANAAATAVVRSYTANPSALGAVVGIIRADSTSFSQAGIAGGILEWDFETGGQPIILRGVAENVAVNFNATTVTGSIVSISVEWSEV